MANVLDRLSIVKCRSRGRAGSISVRGKHQEKVAGAETPDLLEHVKTGTPAEVQSAIEAGAEVNARNEDGKTAFDYAKDNEDLVGTDAYQALKDARF